MTDLTASSLRALKLMDLTTLNDDDTNEKVIALCHQAKTPVGNTAAICIYPRFIPIARKTLKEQGTPDIRIATVTNFPHGNDDIDIALAETRAAIAYGADEVDVVFPYRALIAGNEQVGFDLVKACKDACAAANVLLKVIIETGELKEECTNNCYFFDRHAFPPFYQLPDVGLSYGLSPSSFNTISIEGADVSLSLYSADMSGRLVN